MATQCTSMAPIANQAHLEVANHSRNETLSSMRKDYGVRSFRKHPCARTCVCHRHFSDNYFLLVEIIYQKLEEMMLNLGVIELTLFLKLTSAVGMSVPTHDWGTEDTYDLYSALEIFNDDLYDSADGLGCSMRSGSLLPGGESAQRSSHDEHSKGFTMNEKLPNSKTFSRLRSSFSNKDAPIQNSQDKKAHSSYPQGAPISHEPLQHPLAEDATASRLGVLPGESEIVAEGESQPGSDTLSLNVLKSSSSKHYVPSEFSSRNHELSSAHVLTQGHFHDLVVSRELREFSSEPSISRGIAPSRKTTAVGSNKRRKRKSRNPDNQTFKRKYHTIDRGNNPRRSFHSLVYTRSIIEVELEPFTLNSLEISHAHIEKIIALWAYARIFSKDQQKEAEWVHGFVQRLLNIQLPPSFLKDEPHLGEVLSANLKSSFGESALESLASKLWNIQRGILRRFCIPLDHKDFADELLYFETWFFKQLEMNSFSSFLSGFKEAQTKKSPWEAKTREETGFHAVPQEDIFAATEAINLVGSYYKTQNPIKWKAFFGLDDEPFIFMLEENLSRLWNRSGNLYAKDDLTSLEIFPWATEKPFEEMAQYYGQFMSPNSSGPRILLEKYLSRVDPEPTSLAESLDSSGESGDRSRQRIKTSNVDLVSLLGKTNLNTIKAALRQGTY
ncbi:hypothetical protein O181_060343 [Austropuccinia psidii MF-1]|uniref:Uncharacterized protein n=1 Tax=Austropuccinia psidii MF-1 TaxID=1389203 RepID=A0A9Q3HXG4_9BASI|nr:hypothetical protein [Austropuccinia psidii MF-1]